MDELVAKLVVRGVCWVKQVLDVMTNKEKWMMTMSAWSGIGRWGWVDGAHSVVLL